MELALNIVRYDAVDGVARVALDDPERRNALSDELIGELLTALRHAVGDPDVRCIVLTSTHPTVFCAGGDLAGFASDTPLVHHHAGAKSLVELTRLLGDGGKPSICAANGHVLAGGMGLAFACDLVVASAEAMFGTPEINVGLFPFMVAALISREVPRKRANELFLLGERITAHEARELGFVNRVVAADELDAAVDAWATRLAAKSPLLMQLGKDALSRQTNMGLEDAMDYLRGQLALALSTEDLREGVTAFFEKRDPVWAGR